MECGAVPVEFLLDFYDAFLRDPSYTKVAAALEMKSVKTLEARLQKYPALRYAKKLADERRGNRESLSNYIFKHLSPEAQRMWEEIQFWADSESAYTKVQAILNGKTRKLRQELFIHALVHGGFNLSEACRVVAIPKCTLEEWKTDSEFLQLLEEIQWHKKNFFEHALIDLVEQRHPGATIFVNRTQNADRGYNEKIQVEHTGNVGFGIDFDQLDLDIDTRRKVLEAIRRSKPIEVDVQPPRQLTNGHV